jgi:hypothetical protein
MTNDVVMRNDYLRNFDQVGHKEATGDIIKFNKGEWTAKDRVMNGAVLTAQMSTAILGLSARGLSRNSGTISTHLTRASGLPARTESPAILGTGAIFSVSSTRTEGRSFGRRPASARAVRLATWRSNLPGKTAIQSSGSTQGLTSTPSTARCLSPCSLSLPGRMKRPEEHRRRLSRRQLLRSTLATTSRFDHLKPFGPGRQTGANFVTGFHKSSFHKCTISNLSPSV